MANYHGKLIVGGYFTSAGGAPANYIASWDGNVWSPLGTGVDRYVHALAVYQGTLLAGGEFTTAGNKASAYLAEWTRPEDCCVCPTLGNVDESDDCLVTMGDLTVLIDHLFVTLTPLVCPLSGNVDLSTDELVTMSDLTVMIDHLYITLTPLPVCP